MPDLLAIRCHADTASAPRVDVAIIVDDEYAELHSFEQDEATWEARRMARLLRERQDA